ncbi:MAG TPA: helix-turn-helix transcriptional regulator [Streptosporangiaceae bacterium]|nr:helix-turn-helix transcriptional regulator [Streptosporangiaceae bacterium]
MGDLAEAAPEIGGRVSICQSEMRDALAPAGPGDSRVRRWLVVADGRRLRQLRREHRLPQQELAARAGISVVTISRLERQDHVSCRGRTLTRLAAALGVQPAALMSQPDA